ncbi:4Fe-4S binding protein [Lentisphaerota bacterium WC36G]|nr:4Fe-4S binding protein [Lentisphaerae bacterium WC36]
MNIGRLRFFVQLFFFMFLIYGGLYSLKIGSSLPTFACRYNDYRGGICALYSFQVLLGFPLKTLFTSYFMGFAITILIFGFWAFLFNKAWCGWVCPMGFIQDILSGIRNFLGISAVKFSESRRKKLSCVKFIVLLLLIMIPILISNSFFGLPTLPKELAIPYCNICPAKTAAPMLTGNFEEVKVFGNAGIGIDFKSIIKISLSTLSVIIFSLFIVGSFFKKRFFCTFCPMSALLTLFEKIGLIKLKKDGSKCTHCNNCAKACPLDIQEIATERTKTNMVTSDCTLCMKCIEDCPENNALKATICGKTVFKSSAKGFIKRQIKKNKTKK